MFQAGFPGTSLLVLSVLVGVAAGFAAVLLKAAVAGLNGLLLGTAAAEWPALRFFMPLAGMLLCVFIARRYFRGDLEKGVGRVLQEIARKGGAVKSHKMFSSLATSAITVGFGGSAGLEAPIAVTGAAWGSNTGVRFHLSPRERTTLLAAGAAAGVSASFGAPIAGVLFAVEVLLTGVAYVEMVPLLLASAVGILVSRFTFHETALFAFEHAHGFQPANTGYYLLLGVVAGIAAFAYAKIFLRIEGALGGLRNAPWRRAWIAGLALGLLILVFPPLLGEGFAAVRRIAAGEALSMPAMSALTASLPATLSMILFFVALLVLKPAAAALTLGGGGNGGNFAPSLFVGCVLGWLFAHLLNLSFGLRLPEANFALAGMAGILSGVMYAPLTAIFLIAEATSGYALFIPLMITSSLSFFVVRSLQPVSMDRRALDEKGLIFGENDDRNTLLQIHLRALLEPLTVRPLPGPDRDSVRALVQSAGHDDLVIAETPDGKLWWAPRLTLREQLQYGGDDLAGLGALRPLDQAERLAAGAEAVLNRLEEEGLESIPVLDDRDQILGSVARSRILAEYRRVVRGRRT